MTQIRKLTVGLALMGAVAFIWSLTSLRVIGSLSDFMRSAVGSTTAGIDQLGQIDRAVSDLVGTERALVLHSLFGHNDQVKEYKDVFDSTAKRLEGQIASLPRELTAGSSRQAATQLNDGLRSWKQAHQMLVQWLDSQQADEAEKVLRDRIQPIADQMRESSRTLSRGGTALLDAGGREAASKSALSRWTAVGFLGIFAAIGLLVLAEVRRTGRRLQQVSARVGSSAGEVGSAAEQVAKASRQLSQWTLSQSASVEETSASSQQIQSISSQNAESSRSAADLMSSVDRTIAQANGTLDQMVSSMKEIMTSSENIARIIRIVDEIAFQTNILALNAAVEAARAGDAGLGFAVVADEVRNLAQRSATAARDTTGLIEQSMDRARTGEGHLNEMARLIGEITSSASRVKSLIEDVSTASQEQSDGIRQISAALSQIENVTQQTAASASQTLAAGEGLLEQAGTIGTVVLELAGVVGAGTSS